MLKKITIYLIISSMLLLASCQSSKIELQEVTGISNRISNFIEEILEHHNITYETVRASTNLYTKGLSKGWRAFDLVGEDGGYYTVLLDILPLGVYSDFSALLNSDGWLIEGMINPQMIPAVFENEDRYKYWGGMFIPLYTPHDREIALGRINP